MKKFRLTIVFLILLSYLLIIGREVRAAPITYYRYVVPGGSQTSEYCTRYEPCDLRHAIDNVAQSGDIIVVHSGTYNSILPSTDLITITKNLTLWGSCEFDASTPFICYPDEQNSNLDAELTKRVVGIYGIGVEEVHIEGFTIMRGIGTLMSPTCYGFDGCGAGIYASSLERLTLKNNTLWANEAVRIGGSGGIGGGLFVDNVNYVQAKNNTFIFNQATDTGVGGGGGAFVINSGGPHAVEFDKNFFYNNEISTENSSGNAGAGLLVTASNNVQITDNTFEYQNTLNKSIDIRGSSIYLSSITGYSIEKNTFTNDYGRAVVYIGYETDGRISKNRWWNNTIVYNLELVGDVQADIFNNFLGRQPIAPTSRGGGSSDIFIHSDQISGSNEVDIYFNTFSAANLGVEVGQYSSVGIFNNIFTGLTDAIYLSTTFVTATIDNNLYYSNSNYTNPGSNPIYADPKLVDVANGDFHLLPGSGAIDTAIACDFDEDIDGDIRPIGLGPTPYDVGADEYQVINYLPLILQ